MLKIAGFSRYDLLNNPMSEKPAFTIWFAGCTHGCNGCQNKQLWNKDSGDDYEVDEVIDMIVSHEAQYGIKDAILLGGEPLQQDIDDIKKLCSELSKSGINVWLYTGYDFDDVKSKLDTVMSCLYTIKCGRYVEELAQSGFPATSNQKIFRQSNAGWSEIKI